MTDQQAAILREYCCTAPCRHQCLYYNCDHVFDFIQNISVGYGIEELIMALKFYISQGYENNAIEKFLENYNGISWDNYMRLKNLSNFVVPRDT